jgi:hypothetical protein
MRPPARGERVHRASRTPATWITGAQSMDLESKCSRDSTPVCLGYANPKAAPPRSCSDRDQRVFRAGFMQLACPDRHALLAFPRARWTESTLIVRSRRCAFFLGQFSLCALSARTRADCDRVDRLLARFILDSDQTCSIGLSARSHKGDRGSSRCAPANGTAHESALGAIARDADDERATQRVGGATENHSVPESVNEMSSGARHGGRSTWILQSQRRH